MHGNLPAQAQRSIFPPAKSGDESFRTAKSDNDDSIPEISATSGGECVGWFAAMARKLWGRKAWASIVFLAKVPERSAQRWVADDGEAGATVLRNLLRSDDGDRVLEQCVAGSKSKWVRDLKRGQVALAQLDQWKQLDLGIE